MSDISKCGNEECPVNKTCWRFLAPASAWQSYMEFKYVDGECDGYIKYEKAETPRCPRPECNSTHGNLDSKKIFWCKECGKFLDPKTKKYKDFNRGTVGAHDKCPNADNNYDSANPRSIGTIPVVKEVKY